MAGEHGINTLFNQCVELQTQKDVCDCYRGVGDNKKADYRPRIASSSHIEILAH